MKTKTRGRGTKESLEGGPRTAHAPGREEEGKCHRSNVDAHGMPSIPTMRCCAVRALVEPRRVFAAREDRHGLP